MPTSFRKTPSLIDDPQYLQNHPELNAYLQDHPNVKQEISQRPAPMRLEDEYNRDHDLRDRDANWQGRDGDRGAVAQDRDRDRDAGAPDRDRDRDRDADRRELGDFNRFLDSHREVGEQLRKDPSLADNREFVQSHPALQDYLRDNPEVREQLRQDPNAFMREEIVTSMTAMRINGMPIAKAIEMRTETATGMATGMAATFAKAIANNSQTSIASSTAIAKLPNKCAKIHPF